MRHAGRPRLLLEVSVGNIKSYRRTRVHEACGYRCAYCGQKFEAGQLQVDHVTPKAQGGTSCVSNLVSSCAVCNAFKGPLCRDEFLEKVKRRHSDALATAAFWKQRLDWMQRA